MVTEVQVFLKKEIMFERHMIASKLIKVDLHFGEYVQSYSSVVLGLQ